MKEKAQQAEEIYVLKQHNNDIRVHDCYEPEMLSLRGLVAKHLASGHRGFGLGIKFNVLLLWNSVTLSM